MQSITADKKRLIVLITWLLVAVSSIPFERIHDDEVIYYLESNHILIAGPFAHASLIFVPELLGALVLVIYKSLIAIRIVSALMVLGTAILTYKIRNDNSSFISSMLFLTSFYTIRFGFRYYLDPYGAFFTIAAIYFLYKEKSHLVGVYSMISVFSRATISPIFPIYAMLVYRNKIGLRKFLIGAGIVAALGIVWIYISSASAEHVVSTNVAQISTVSYAVSRSGYAILKGWVQYVLISPLIVLGLIFAGGGRGKNEFYPLLLSFVVMSLAPGFISYGGATEYPYIFNAIACLVAGMGLERAYKKFFPTDRSFVRVVVALILLQFAAQSYLATSISVNHAVDMEDYGYSYDQQLLTYMNQHYNGGQIYSSTNIVFLDPMLSANSIWISQNVTSAIVNDPPWFITFSSYVVVKVAPVNSSIVTMGPFVIIQRGPNVLSSFVERSNATEFFQ